MLVEIKQEESDPKYKIEYESGRIYELHVFKRKSFLWFKYWKKIGQAFYFEEEKAKQIIVKDKNPPTIKYYK